MDPIYTKALIIYGPLGLYAIASTIVIIRQYKDREKERKAHNSEMRLLEDKFVAKSEEWVEQYHNLASATNELLKSVLRKIDGRRGESSPRHPYRSYDDDDGSDPR